MDELVSPDLLSLISLYATTDVALRVLTSFIPGFAYKISTWKLKTIKEARGLVLDRIEYDRAWWDYYLLKNCTMFGDVILTNVESDVGEYSTTSEIIHSNVLYHTTLQPHDLPSLDITQTSDFTIRFGKRKVKFNRRIRDAKLPSRPGEFTGRVLILDEYGDVWMFYGNVNDHRSHIRVIDQYLPGKGIVQILNANDNGDPIFLNRDGNLITLDWLGKVTIHSNPKTIHYTINPKYGWQHEQTKDYAGILTLPNGKHVYVHKCALGRCVVQPASMIDIAEMSQFHDEYQYTFDQIRPNFKYLYPDVEPILDSPYVVTSIPNWELFSGETIYSTNDRTVYLILRSEPFGVRLDITFYRTQRLEQQSRTPDVYTIVDPILNK